MTEYANAKIYGVFSTPESRQIIKQLKQENAEYREFPPANIVLRKKDENNYEYNSLNFNLIESTDWLIFFEPVAVKFFLNRLKEIEYDLYNLDKLRICVLGELTADALRYEQIHTDIILESYDQSVVEMIGNFLGDSDSFRTQKIVIIRNNSTELKSEDEILKNNPQCQIIKICESNFSDKSDLSKNKILLKNGAVDEMILTSPDDLISLRDYLNVTDNYEISELKFVANDENIIRFINSNGLKCQRFILKRA